MRPVGVTDSFPPPSSGEEITLQLDGFQRALVCTGMAMTTAGLILMESPREFHLLIATSNSHTKASSPIINLANCSQ